MSEQTPPSIPLKDKIGKPLFWLAMGFVTCKILDAYTENKRAKRLAP